MAQVFSCFCSVGALGRPVANLMEWGQQFMATLEVLEMLGAFLLVFTPNKKQFPLLKGLLFSGLEDEWLGGGLLGLEV